MNDSRGVLCVTILALTMLACRSVSVKGVIQTADEKPIEGATLQLVPVDSTRSSLTGTSESHGCFNLFRTVGRRGGDYLLAIEFPGYKPFTAHVSAGAENLLQVILQPIGSTAESEARPISWSRRYAVYGVPCEPEVTASPLTLH